MEIIDNKLVVSRKKKTVLVNELRQRGYEAFPKGKDPQLPNNDNNAENDDEISSEEDSGARDYDYLLGVSSTILLCNFLTNLYKATYLVPDPGACR